MSRIRHSSWPSEVWSSRWVCEVYAVESPAHQRAFFFGVTGFRHARQRVLRPVSCQRLMWASDEQ